MNKITTVTKTNQFVVTIPKDFAEKLGFKDKDKVTWTVLKNGLKLQRL